MTITYKKHVLPTGKEIHIYDGLLPLSLRAQAWEFFNGSLFRLGWGDTTTEKGIKHKYLYSTYNDADNENCGVLPFLRTTQVQNHIEGLNLDQAMVNLSIPTDAHWAHVHPKKLVVLYYANLDWEQHWHGETLFYTEDLNDIELALRYTPGRVVIFDASIPHAIRPQSSEADNYRFTYAMTFN